MTEAHPWFPQRGEVAARMREIDWSKTPMGDPSTWPASLHSTIRLMLASRYAMWLGWGPELHFFYNDAYRVETLGTKHPRALGLPASQVWAEIWESLVPRVDQVLKTGEATWDEGLLLFLERSGYREETYHTFSYSPAFDDAGKIGGLFCVVVEETERVIGERRIAVLRDLAASMAAAKTQPEVLAALEHVVTNAARKLTFSVTYLVDEDDGFFHRGAVTGIPAAHPCAPSTIDAADVARDPWKLSDVIGTNGSVVVALDATAPWPSEPWGQPSTHALVVPIHLPGREGTAGVFVAGLSPFRRIDDGVKSFFELFVGQLAAGLGNALAYEEAEERARALAELDRAKTAFFSNVSHELRTPLTLMLGPTSEALASPERALRGSELDMVYRNELRLLKLVNALLDFARNEAGRAQAHFAPFDLSSLTTDLASAFRSTIERGGLELVVDAEPLGEAVYVDRDMWEKIVLNLLSNAFKFTFEGSIRLTLRQRDRFVELRVADSGVGIANENLPRVFDRFHRIEGTRSRTHEGTGIGLALVRDLVRLHAGTIEVESEVGKGTTFIVTLPFGREHLPAEHVSSETRASGDATRTMSFLAEAARWLPRSGDEPASGRRPAPVVAEEPRPRILLADDNPDMRDYVSRLLGEHWDVEAVSDGVEALEAAERQVPALVVSDVMMPRLDGFELVKRLRTNRKTASTPILLLSARAGEEEAAVGLRTGADDYLVKPFSAGALVVRVEALLARAQYREALAKAEEDARNRELAALTHERKVAEEARAEAEIANRLKDEFLATMSHELRTPLNAILGWSALLVRDADDPVRRNKALATIERNARAQARLIEDVLEVSRIVTGKLRIEPRRIKVASVINAAVDVVRHGAEAKAVALKVTIDEDVGEIWADPDRLQQVVWNVLSNAVKFTPQDGHIEITVTRSESHVRIVVTDDGMGIPPEHLPHVFDRFRQVDSSTTRRFGGLGLGLAIVRHLTEMHGGRVNASSEGEGKGSTFTVVLPIRAVAPTGDAPTSAAVSSGSSPNTAAAEPLVLEGLRILVVDDDEDSRMILTETLRTAGATTVAAESARAALGALATDRFDLMVSDIGMPGEDGYALLEQVRIHDDRRVADIPAIALTAYARPVDATRARAAGYEHHLAKPVDPDVLVAMVMNTAKR